MSDHSVDDIRAHVRVYLMVFGALAVLTIVTVGVSYLGLSIGPAIALALLIATVKASLVALFFMHLKGEVRWVLWALLLTAVFFVFLTVIPLSTFADHTGTPIQAPAAAHGEHASAHGDSGEHSEH